LRRQHAHADFFDDVPDAVDVVFFAHVKHYTELHPDFQIHKARVPAATAHAGVLSARTQALPWGAHSHLLSAGIKNRLYRNDRFWRKEDVRLESKGYLFGASDR
jgi:hypothetical protein